MKDKIFSNKKMKITDFKFNRKVATSFDDMVSRSVPYYTQVQNDIISLASNYVSDNSKILDLGCSTGTLLVNLLKVNQSKKNLKLVGIDSSHDMIKLAKQKISKNKKKNFFKFIKNDFLKFKSKEVKSIELKDLPSSERQIIILLVWIFCILKLLDSLIIRSGIRFLYWLIPSLIQFFFILPIAFIDNLLVWSIKKFIYSSSR